MEVKKIVEGMTAVEVDEVFDSNFKNQNKILEEDIATQNSVIGVSEYKDFSEAEAVNVGDVRKYEGFLYECVEATTGAFDASKWKKSSFKAETEKKLAELGSEVDNVFYLFSKEFSTENKFYSAIDGSYSYSSVVASTDLIQIINKEIFAYCYLGGNEYPQYGIVFFDKDKRFINSSYNSEQKGYKKVYLTNEIPENAVYFVACKITTTTPKALCYAFSRSDDSAVKKAIKDIEDLQSDIDDLRMTDDIVTNVDTQYNKGIAYNDDGSPVSIESMSSSNKIKVKGGTIYYSGGIGGNFKGVLCLNESNEVIGQFLESGTYEHEKVELPKDTAYIIIQGRNESHNDFSVQLSAKYVLPIIELLKDITINLQGNIISGKVVNNNTGEETTIAASFPNSACTDYISVRSGSSLLVSGWFGSAVGVAGYDKSLNYVSRIADSSTDSKYNIEYADDYEVKIPNDVSYIRVSTKDYANYPIKIASVASVEKSISELVGEVDELKKKENGQITIRKKTDTSFEVVVPQFNSETPLVHEFVRQYSKSLLNYGNGLAKEMVSTDIWYPSDVYYKGEKCMQGNLNFIYYASEKVDGYEYENSHVGAGHGCEIAKVQKFYADGHEINLSELTQMECKVFSVVCYAEDFACDTRQPNFSSSDAKLKLDENGNPILTAVHCYNAEYHIGNEIKWENQLLVKRNNLKFYQCHGAMIQGNLSFFDNIVICGKEFNINQVSYNNDSGWDYNALAGKKINESVYSSADTIILQGEGSMVKQSMRKVGSVDDNYTFSINYNNPDRTKHYQMPVKTSLQFGLDDADVFNNGDVIRVLCERKIDINR